VNKGQVILVRERMIGGTVRKQHRNKHRLFVTRYLVYKLGIRWQAGQPSQPTFWMHQPNRADPKLLLCYSLLATVGPIAIFATLQCTSAERPIALVRLAGCRKTIIGHAKGSRRPLSLANCLAGLPIIRNPLRVIALPDQSRGLFL
jgi:hypothetical protein